MTYTLTPSTITCHICGLTSHNLHDVRFRYCGNCHRFHDDDVLPDNFMKKQPTPEQAAALKAYAKQHGRLWKGELRNAWMTGVYDRATIEREHDGLLQQVRNTLGPSWLITYTP